MSTRYHPCSLAGDAPSLAGDKEKKKEKKGVAQDAVDFVIKPEATPPLDTSKWPLLLKDYDQLNVRTGHYTPIPNGHTPLKRPLSEYLKYGVCNLDNELDSNGDIIMMIAAWRRWIRQKAVPKAVTPAKNMT